MSAMWLTVVEQAAMKLSRLRIWLHAVSRMRYVFAAIIASILLVSLILLFPAAGAYSPGVLDAEIAMAAPADNSLSWFIRGYNYQSWWNDDYLSQRSAASLDRISDTGANWVTIGPTQYMENAQSVSIGPEINGRTATDAAIARAIDDAHARGLSVMLKPHIDVQDDTWRGEIHPSDQNAWFANYKAMMDGYAQLASDHQVEMIAVGTELWSMTGPENNAEWSSIIASIRSLYGGQLTYAASQNEYRGINFWDKLDFLGVNIYYPLSDTARPSVDELIAGWTNYNGQYGQTDWVSTIEAWQSNWGKPVIFTEIGYRSTAYTARSPWDYWFTGEYDGDLQARAYEAVFRVFGNKPWMAGALWWNWGVGDNGGQGDTNYTVVNKPSEAVVTGWFTSPASTQPTLSVTSGNVSWSSYADYRARFLHVTYNVSNSSVTAHQVAVVADTASSGVVLASSVPINIGDISQGSTVDYEAVYHVPSGIGSFTAVPYLSFVDSAGWTSYLPGPPPATITG